MSLQTHLLATFLAMNIGIYNCTREWICACKERESVCVWVREKVCVKQTNHFWFYFFTVSKSNSNWRQKKKKNPIRGGVQRKTVCLCVCVCVCVCVFRGKPSVCVVTWKSVCVCVWVIKFLVGSFLHCKDGFFEQNTFNQSFNLLLCKQTCEKPWKLKYGKSFQLWNFKL